jgi:hypothetical protein
LFLPRLVDGPPGPSSNYWRWTKLGKTSGPDCIDWSAPRLVCIAADFTKYDGHAVQQINRNIELIRYRRFGDELLAVWSSPNAHYRETTVMGTAHQVRPKRPKV